ncbi:uncharacterized protein DUF397 [Stackebrandtia endophytica]|uniref:Uncharacterized protein DUF397 n=1 Tax=Stackebrandtia endophytica TaxID=1496996 RepID=A0A543B1V0_9ACTN|nr:DUF397 domain-containing protein [Stackebrandtia endophytica]TQL78828.1 uncharacterized protein DUF397 [Stackebrandtia endophytica]
MTPGNWRKASRSNATGGNCVETRTFNHVSAAVEVRDSKAPQLGSLAIDRTEFTALLDSLKLQRLRSSGPPGRWAAVSLPWPKGLAFLHLLVCSMTG